MRSQITITLFALLLSGCLAPQLAKPTEGHAFEARTVADRCANGGYYDLDGDEEPDPQPCPEWLTEDLEETAKQAERIHEIVKDSAGGGIGGAK